MPFVERSVRTAPYRNAAAKVLTGLIFPLGQRLRTLAEQFAPAFVAAFLFGIVMPRDIGELARLLCTECCEFYHCFQVLLRPTDKKSAPYKDNEISILSVRGAVEIIS